jgi:hypothetical protein
MTEVVFMQYGIEFNTVLLKSFPSGDKLFMVNNRVILTDHRNVEKV